MRFLVLVVWLLAGAARAADVPVIAAAANVKYALDEIAAAFAADTGSSVRIAYGASGNLAQQIANGAPFELLLAADEATVARLAAAGFTRDAGTVYAIGRLVLFVPQGSPLKADASLADLKAATGDGRVRRFAIANPEHAPYGRAAQQALEHAGAWQALRSRLVLGESVSQAMQFAAGGDAQGGLVPLALASARGIADKGRYAVIPEAAHEPLRQRMALLNRAGPIAVRFETYVRGAKARAILVRHGYAVPDDAR